MRIHKVLIALATAALSVGLSVGAFAADAKKGKEAGSSATRKQAPAKPEAAAKEGGAAASQAKTDAAAVAVVNGTAIPRAEYDRALRAYVQSARQAPGAEAAATTEPDQQMKEEVLNQLVDRELLYQESRKYVTEDSKAEAETELSNLKARFPSPEVFQEAIKAQSLTEAELKGLILKQVTVRKYIDKQVAPTATVSDDEIKKFYEENKDKLTVPEQVEASHILVRVAEDTKPEDKDKAKAKAQDLQKKAAGGADFAQLAKDNSEDPGSAPNGGALGYFSKEQMVEPFAVAAFGLKPGSVSDVVETPFGFHVIKVTGHKDAGTRPLEEVKDDLTNYLKARALNEALVKKVADLRKGAKIEIPKS